MKAELWPQGQDNQTDINEWEETVGTSREGEEVNGLNRSRGLGSGAAGIRDRCRQ